MIVISHGDGDVSGGPIIWVMYFGRQFGLRCLRSSIEYKSPLKEAQYRMMKRNILIGWFWIIVGSVLFGSTLFAGITFEWRSIWAPFDWILMFGSGTLLDIYGILRIRNLACPVSHYRARIWTWIVPLNQRPIGCRTSCRWRCSSALLSPKVSRRRTTYGFTLPR